MARGRAAEAVELSETALPSTSIGGSIRRWLSAVGPLTSLVIVGVWLWVSLRAMPRPFTDYGVFLAVAERLQAGERLYVDVWDNKDPLIYLSLAGARLGGTAGAWALEVLWLITASIGTYLVARWSGATARLSAVIGLILAPLVVLGSTYFMGTTHLPGVALTMVATAAALRGRYLGSGVLLGFVALFKLIMAPLAAALVITVAVSQRRAGMLLRSAAGVVIAVVPVLTLLALRGELSGYAHSLTLNVSYSQTPIDAARPLTLAEKVGQHLVVFADWHVALTIAATVGIVIVVWALGRRGSAGSRSTNAAALRRLVVVAFVAELVILAITGKLVHHGEILVVSSLLALALLGVTVAQRWPRAPLAAVAACAGASFLLAGAPSPWPYLEAGINARATWTATAGSDPVTDILRELPPGSFAIVGQGNNLPRSPGLDEWRLACPQLAQRPIDPPTILDETATCIGAADVVILAPDAIRYEEFPHWNGFLDSVEATLARDYACSEVGDFTVCQSNARQTP